MGLPLSFYFISLVLQKKKTCGVCAVLFSQQQVVTLSRNFKYSSCTVVLSITSLFSLVCPHIAYLCHFPYMMSLHYSCFAFASKYLCYKIPI